MLQKHIYRIKWHTKQDKYLNKFGMELMKFKKKPHATNIKETKSSIQLEKCTQKAF